MTDEPVTGTTWAAPDSSTVSALPRLHIITDDGVLRSPDFGDLVAELFSRGEARIAVHLRGHETSGRTLWDRAEHCAELAGRSGSMVIVNDRLDIAIASGATGVQLGHRSLGVLEARRIVGETRLIGASVHDEEGAALAAREGADFLIAGTIFRTRSHPETSPSGAGWLGRISGLGVPVIGIGGVSPRRVREVRGAGAYGVAVLGGIWMADAPVRAMVAYLSELDMEGDDV